MFLALFEVENIRNRQLMMYCDVSWFVFIFFLAAANLDPDFILSRNVFPGLLAGVRWKGGWRNSTPLRLNEDVTGVENETSQTMLIQFEAAL